MKNVQSSASMYRINCRISDNARTKLDALREHYMKKNGVSKLSYPRLIEIMATELTAKHR